ncbi:uncharacterized protein LOC116177834 [Photinus pyralis]|uniref:uncharacterized protein LOC116177834 n=1 Tax=Photinus pyralis TaxID=7054 RepID=UPI0012676C93|nr:uncharacterized protein LOC116177834 [Photinus pyralis]
MLRLLLIVSYAACFFAKSNYLVDAISNVQESEPSSNAAPANHLDWRKAILQHLDVADNNGGGSPLLSVLVNDQNEKLKSVVETLQPSDPNRKVEVTSFLLNRNTGSEPKVNEKLRAFKLVDDKEVLKMFNRTSASAALDAIDTDQDAIRTANIKAGKHNVRLSLKRKSFIFGRSQQANTALVLLLATGRLDAASELLKLYAASCSH